MVHLSYVHCAFHGQEYKVYSYFRQQWRDPRLAGKLNHTITIKGGDIEKFGFQTPTAITRVNRT